MKPERFAQDAARFIKSMERMEGVVMLDTTRDRPQLVILSCPEPPTPDQEFVEDLLGFSTHHDSHRPGWLGRQLGAREVLELTPGKLGRWLYKLQLLQRSRNLETLIRSGTGALKRYQNVDIRAKIDVFTKTYTRLRDLHHLVDCTETAPLMPYLVHASWMLPDSTSHTYRQSLRAALTIALERVHTYEITHPDVLGALMSVAGFCGEEGARSVAEETHLGTRFEIGARATSPAMLAVACTQGMHAHTLDELLACGNSKGGQWAAMACANVGSLLGVRAAQEMIHHGTMNLRQSAERERTIADCAQRFLEGCRTLAHPERLGELPSSMSDLRHHTYDATLTRELARHLVWMLEAVGIHADQLPSKTALWRAALAASPTHDPSLTGDALWRTVYTHASLHKPSEDLSLTRALCRLTLMMPGVPMPGISKLERDDIKQLSWMIKGMPTSTARALLPSFIAHTPEGMKHGIKALLNDVALTPDEYEFIVAHSFIVEHIDELPRQPSNRKALQQCVQGLSSMGLLEHLDVENGWIVRLFADDAHNPDFNVLTIARALSRTQHHTTLASQINAFCHAAQRQDSSLSRAMATWREVRAPSEAQAAHIDQLARKFIEPRDADDLHTVQAQIGRYTHHKHLLNEPEELSRNILKKLINPTTSLDNQIAALTKKIEDEHTPEEQRARHLARLKSLRGCEHPDARRKRLKAAKNLLAQSLAQLESRSLAALLDGALLDVLAHVTGRTHPVEVLTPELRSVLAVSQSEEYDPTLFAHFLTTALGDAPRIALPENERWLATISHTSIDLACWERGFSTHTSHGETKLHIKTEHDLLRAAHMGTWFDTCLSLKDGFHAMSALSHVLDANKHIIYVENARGEVIARKLIAISTTHKLIGYPLYVREGISKESLAAVVDGAIAAFAKRCELSFSGEGKPFEIRKLSGDGLYYDGVTSWHLDRHDHDAMPTPPAYWGEDMDGAIEWALLKARETKDVTLTKAVAWRMRKPWCEYAAADLIAYDQEAATRWLIAHPQGWDPPVPVVHAIWRHGNYTARERHEMMNLTAYADDIWRTIELAMWNMPMTPDLMDEFEGRIHRTMSTLEKQKKTFEASSFEHMGRNHTLLGHQPLAPLLELIDQAVALYHSRGHSGEWHDSEAEHLRYDYHRALQISWLMHGPNEHALSDMIRRARHHDTVGVVAMLAAETPSDMVARALWARWSQHDTRHMSRQVLHHLLDALVAQDDTLKGLPIPDELTPRSIDSPETLREHVLAHTRRNGEARHERRALVRIIEETQLMCRTQRLNQITQDEVYKRFEELAKSQHDEMVHMITYHASLCHIDDLSAHDKALARLTALAQRMQDRRERGDVNSLSYKRRFVQGTQDERVEAVRQELARYDREDRLRIGLIIWVFARDLADQFTPEELIKLAHISLPMTNIAYNVRCHVEAFLGWMSFHPQPEEAVREWADEHTNAHKFDDASETGVVALIDALDHESPTIRSVASATLLVVSEHAEEWGRMEALMHVMHRVRSDEGVAFRQKMIDLMFTPSALHDYYDALTPEMLSKHVYPSDSWRDPLSFSALRLLMQRASEVWSPAQLEECRTLINANLQRPRTRACAALWDHIINAT